ncbi:8343_t:CDS:2 [Paraglomus brasilianum]|uniref:8343_t:CDS:1 n=1 Tax=Paraglomus brasilianum TaxID=144538 RepID=A0A9N9D418_9GLOM|nr:8343_t:CDS:2 [Paraglomus brasilianum]
MIENMYATDTFADEDMRGESEQEIHVIQTDSEEIAVRKKGGVSNKEEGENEEYMGKKKRYIATNCKSTTSIIFTDNQLQMIVENTNKYEQTKGFSDGVFLH